MKTIAAVFFLSSGFFTLMVIFGELAGWTQGITGLAIASLVFGASATAAGHYYLRRKRS